MFWTKVVDKIKHALFFQYIFLTKERMWEKVGRPTQATDDDIILDRKDSLCMQDN